MSAESAFLEALASARESGGDSNFRLALESVGGSNRALADELGVSIRTVQRWAAYEEGGGKQARNPEASPVAGDLKAMADVERDQRALDKLAGADSFNAEIDVDYTGGGRAQDEGSRSAYNVLAFNMAPVVEAYRSGAPLADVGAQLTSAIAESYGLPAAVEIKDVGSFSVS